jgi:biotin-[acetyl-CoA-carboxylase] ligase BirA-like protein
MIVYADNIQFAEQYLTDKLKWQIVSPSRLEEKIRTLACKLFPHERIYQGAIDTNYLWQYAFFVEYASESQFDVLVDLSQKNSELPHGNLCIAGSGEKFHGLRNRPWVSLAGNIHLSAFLAPQQEVDHFGVGFVILAAVSVLQALDSIAGLAKRAMAKWVNDILIGDAKVCGVLAHTQMQERIVTGAILGIGLNVEAKPQVEPTPYVPEVAALRDFIPNRVLCNQSIVFHRLLHFLDQNYRRLISGHFSELLDLYRKRSLVIGKTVSVFTDAPNGKSEKIVHGKVKSIGANLELIFDGIDSPISKGRVVLPS